MDLERATKRSWFVIASRKTDPTAEPWRTMVEARTMEGAIDVGKHRMLVELGGDFVADFDWLAMSKMLTPEQNEREAQTQFLKACRIDQDVAVGVTRQAVEILAKGLKQVAEVDVRLTYAFEQAMEMLNRAADAVETGKEFEV